MRFFSTKGQGRIYVTSLADIPKIKSIIKRMDKYEYEYLPQDIFALYSDFPAPEFTGKFDDLDLDALAVNCMQEGICMCAIDHTNDVSFEKTISGGIIRTIKP